MRILLDECVPVQVAGAFPGHQVHSATDPRWRGLSNRELLSLAEEQGSDLLVVADKNMRHQQNPPGEVSRMFFRLEPICPSTSATRLGALPVFHKSSI